MLKKMFTILLFVLNISILCGCSDECCYCKQIPADNGVVRYPVYGETDDEDYANLLEGVEVTLDCSISAKSEDRYFAIFEINGKKTAVYFNAATKLLQMLHYYGGEEVIVTYVSH